MAHSGTIVFMRTVPGKPDHRALTQPLACPMWPGWTGPHEIPVGFESDGSSSGIFAPIFPRHQHPVAYFRHDWRCSRARNATERRWADKQFREDVGTTSWWITKQIGYLGVRIGALLGIGCQYKGDRQCSKN